MWCLRKNSVRRLRRQVVGRRDGYRRQALHLGLIPFLVLGLGPPVGNKQAPDEKSAQKVHCGASAFEDPDESGLLRMEPPSG